MDDWSAADNEAMLSEYFSMLEQELSGQPYVKTRHNERVREQTGRSRGSVEFKFQNVSAAMRDLHAPWIEGYKPARNYQNALVRAVEAYLTDNPPLLDLMRENVEHTAAPRLDFSWNVVAPPVDLTFGGSSDLRV